MKTLWIVFTIVLIASFAYATTAPFPPWITKITGDVTYNSKGASALAADISHTGFTKLGSTAPNIKMKKLTGTGGTVEGWTTNVAHGLGDISKIISATIMLTAPNGNLIPPSFTDVAEFQYDFLITPTNFVASGTATNSGSILASSPFVVLLTLEE